MLSNLNDYALDEYLQGKHGELARQEAIQELINFGNDQTHILKNAIYLALSYLEGPNVSGQSINKAYWILRDALKDIGENKP